MPRIMPKRTATTKRGPANEPPSPSAATSAVASPTSPSRAANARRPKSARTPTPLSREEARRFLVAHLGLAHGALSGAEGVRALLRQLRCIQLDPLDVVGTNADLVALARVHGIARGDVYRHLFPGHAFEHFAKERCLLPPSAFPWYRARAHRAAVPWWRHRERMERLPRGVLRKVLDEVRARGPIVASELADHGAVDPIDWAGWRGTAKATAMALEVLWTRCEVVVAGRAGRAGKIWDVPERALAEVAAADAPSREFERWAILERVEAAGLLARAAGATWSMLGAARSSPLPDRLVAEGAIEEVVVEGAMRPYLAPAGFRDRPLPADTDDRVRILGPLDPLIWDRKLVDQVFGFDYIWEVYKPASERRWGWYVCPLLHRGQLVGRIEARIDGRTLVIDRLWPERGADLPPEALDAAFERHALACGADCVARPKPRRRQPPASSGVGAAGATVGAAGVAAGRPERRKSRSRSRKTRTV
jgi:uncharacterized protein YcaQ